MDIFSESILANLFWLIVQSGFAGVVVWGWWHWARSPKLWTVLSVFSLLGFFLATFNCLLSIWTLERARVIGGFAYHDPLLMRIFDWGTRLSLAGMACSLVGVWRSHPVRWHALGCSFAMLFFWVTMAVSE